MQVKFFQCFLGLAVVLVSVFFTQTSVAFGTNATQHTYHQKNEQELLVIPESPVQFPAIQLPLESVPIPTDRDIPNENEQEDDFDYCGSPLAEQQTLFTLFNLTSTVHQLAQSFCAIQTITAVPLFVLYHSWKNFVL